MAEILKITMGKAILFATEKRSLQRMTIGTSVRKLFKLSEFHVDYFRTIMIWKLNMTSYKKLYKIGVI